MQLAALHDDGQRLVVLEPEDVLDPRPAVPVGAFDRADVGDLTTARGVEGRLGELDEIARCRRTVAGRIRRRGGAVADAGAVAVCGPELAHRGDGRRLLLGLVAGEAARDAAL